LKIPDEEHIGKSMVFYCKMKKILGFRLLDKIYIIHNAPEDDSKITNNLFLFKCLNTRALQTAFHLYNGTIKYGNINPVEKLTFKNWVDFDDLTYKSDFSTLEIIKLKIPPPNSNTNIKLKTFKLLFYNMIELNDYSNIWLIKTLNTKYYFNKLLLSENINNCILNLENNILKSFNSINNLNNKLNLNLLTKYNNMISLSSKYYITNTYVYTSQIKKLLKLNNLLININNKNNNISEELLNSLTNNLYELIKLYYIDISNLIINTKNTCNLNHYGNNLLVKSDDFDSLINLNKNVETKLKGNLHGNELLNKIFKLAIKDNYTIENIDDNNLTVHLFNNKISFQDKTGKFIYGDVIKKRYVDLFKFNLWEVDLKEFIKFLYNLDKNLDIYYNIMTTIEKNILKLKIL